jgi:hypothetical protein
MLPPFSTMGQASLSTTARALPQRSAPVAGLALRWGRATLIHAWIEQNFSRALNDTDIKALTRAFEKLSTHTRTHRPGRDDA